MTAPTATPLHLGSRDLHTLLNALRPSEFRDPNVFDRDLRHHRGVLEAEGLVRSRKAEALATAATLLRGVFTADEDEPSHDPRAAAVIAELLTSAPVDRRGWVGLERRVQDLHPLSTIVTRTRKRDVTADAPLRRARVIHCRWTSQEDDAYQQLVAGSTSRGWITERLSFGQVQRARQAASCLPAALEAMGLAVATNDDDAVEDSDILPSESFVGGNGSGGEIRGGQRPSVLTKDSKFEKLQELLDRINEEDPDAKVLIFTFFKGTARYLEDRLSRAGWKSLRIDGDNGACGGTTGFTGEFNSGSVRGIHRGNRCSDRGPDSDRALPRGGCHRIHC
jgi:hypothetical protein